MTVEAVEASDIGVEELLDEMLDLHGEGLVRVLEALGEVPDLRDKLVADPVVSSMLLVHGLHPVPLEERVAGALARVRPYLESHGGDVQLLSLDEGVARLRLHGSCDGCAASASTLELAIAKALEEDAPDLEGLDVEGVVAARQPQKRLPLLGADVKPAQWLEIDATPLPDTLTLARPGLVLANVSGTLLAYRDSCAACGSTLADGELEGGVLTCRACARQFALALAGRSVDGIDDAQLEPLPLLETDGRTRVATGA